MGKPQHLWGRRTRESHEKKKEGGLHDSNKSQGNSTSQDHCWHLNLPSPGPFWTGLNPKSITYQDVFCMSQKQRGASARRKTFPFKGGFVPPMEWWLQKTMNTPVSSRDGAEGSKHWCWRGGRALAPKHLSILTMSQSHMLLNLRDQALTCRPLTCKLQSLCSWTWQEPLGKKGSQEKGEQEKGEKEGTWKFLLTTFERPRVNWIWSPGKT